MLVQKIKQGVIASTPSAQLITNNLDSNFKVIVLIRFLILGSEQALAPVREPDTFAEGAWDKVPKTKGTFDPALQNTTSHSYYNFLIDLLFICIKMLCPIFKEKF
jgi:hypothetical protein